MVMVMMMTMMMMMMMMMVVVGGDDDDGSDDDHHDHDTMRSLSLRVQRREKTLLSCAAQAPLEDWKVYNVYVQRLGS